MGRRRGFTLIELVVVVLIVGIIAAVALPRLPELTDRSRESALRHTLGVVRDAIELYRTRNGGARPGEQATEADLKADLKPYLRQFPKNPFKDSASVSVKSDGAAMTGTVSGGWGWRYDCTSGEFIANSNGMASDGVNRHWQL